MKRLCLRAAVPAPAEASIAAARSLGYREMLLDTPSTMALAVALYRALGFESVPAYHHDPAPGAVFFQKALWCQSRRSE